MSLSVMAVSVTAISDGYISDGYISDNYMREDHRRMQAAAHSLRSLTRPGDAARRRGPNSAARRPAAFHATGLECHRPTRLGMPETDGR